MAIVYRQQFIFVTLSPSSVHVYLLLAAGVLGSFQLSLVEAFYVAYLLLLSLDFFLELILLHLCNSSLRCSPSHLAF